MNYELDEMEIFKFFKNHKIKRHCFTETLNKLN